MTTFIFAPTPSRGWINRMAQRDGAAYELWLNPRPAPVLKLPLASKG